MFFGFTVFTLLCMLTSVKSAKNVNFSDSFYFTFSTDYADYNYFTDFVKTKISIFQELCRSAVNGDKWDVFGGGAYY